ncbi:NAD(P)H-dependent oxidoreductase [Leptothoe sp. PORK10 BA2]|uniref:NAD(P)H-dependent oxidoreductase n=1 Tax=Leptothoe sp. PORK10 BA2 TaxID=3110254 RepID=UPI002B202FDE|nr:NAD(P)H-dependent oxidoreductase [Leptothoe sp. PORK10 BA2]MEA5464116.1 NAD(P)H-dependent oxidoreductase [Leptothoe sp. PORK10 BA2]
MTAPNFSSASVLDALNWRYATKMFDASKKIPTDTWSALEQSLVLAPSSFGLEPWKFFVVDDTAVRAKLLEASWKQAQVVEASHLVVLAIKTGLSEADVDRAMARTAEVRDASLESLQGFGNVIKNFMKNVPDVDGWSTRQTYIALGQLMVSAALLGIDTCPIEGFMPAQYDEILGLSEMGYHSVVVCAAGYRSEADKYAHLPKVRFPVEDKVQHI